MYIVKIGAGKGKFIKGLLTKKGLHVEDTIMPEFIVTARDPSQFIPPEYIEFVTIKPSDGRDYISILKNAGIIRNITGTAERMSFGAPVRITDGPYSGCTGRFLEAVPNKEKECAVEINVWGKIIKALVPRTAVEPFESPFS